MDHDMKRVTGITIVLLSVMLQAGLSQEGGRGNANTLNSVPGLTTAQRALLVRANEDLSLQAGAVTAARNALAAAALAEPRNPAAIPIMSGAVREAELALAIAHANVLARIQSSPDRLSPDQVAAWNRVASSAQGGGRGRGAAVYLTQRQADALARMNTDLAPLTQAAAAARSALLAAPAAEQTAKADALKSAELALANARADEFTRLQASPAKLSPDYVAFLVASAGAIGGGRGGGGGLGFTLPEPIDFNGHEGYSPLFDGVSLKGWDGNPKFWRVEGGAIVGESTPQNPSGNSYIVYRDVEAKDFTLKFEIKIEGSGGSGMQYRSKTGIPWLAPIAPNVTANVGPVNLNWNDRSAGGLLAECAVLDGPVLLRKHTHAHHGVARPGGGRRGYGNEAVDGKYRRPRCARKTRAHERLEPVHRDRARRRAHPHFEWPVDGGDGR